MIFGRHPAVIIGFIQSILFGVAYYAGWSDAQVMGVVAVLVVLGDLAIAGFTTDTLLGVLVGLAKAVLAAVMLFGVTVDPQFEAIILSVVTAFVAMLQMNAVSPAAKPSLTKGWTAPQAAKSPTPAA